MADELYKLSPVQQADEDAKASAKPAAGKTQADAANKQWKSKQDNIQRVQTGFEGAATAAHAAVGEYDTAGAALKQGQDAATQQLRRQAAASIAGMQGRSAGGGGQLAALNQASLDRGVAEGAMNADWLDRAAKNRLGRNQAQAAAAQADIDVGTGLQTLENAAQSGIDAGAALATKLHGDFIKDMDADVGYTTYEDRKRWLDTNPELQAALRSPDPAIREAAQTFIQNAGVNDAYASEY